MPVSRGVCVLFGQARLAATSQILRRDIHNILICQPGRREKALSSSKSLSVHRRSLCAVVKPGQIAKTASCVRPAVSGALHGVEVDEFQGHLFERKCCPATPGTWQENRRVDGDLGALVQAFRSSLQPSLSRYP